MREVNDEEDWWWFWKRELDDEEEEESQKDSGKKNMWELKCDRCKMTTEEVETCPWCSRFVCNNCKDEFSGLCIDCTTILLKKVSKVSIAEILRRIEEEILALGLSEVLRRIREEEEQEELDRALQGYAEMMEDFESCLEESPSEYCPNCGNDEIEEVPFFEGRYKCLNCGYEWTE